MSIFGESLQLYNSMSLCLLWCSELMMTYGYLFAPSRRSRRTRLQTRMLSLKPPPPCQLNTPTARSPSTTSETWGLYAASSSGKGLTALMIWRWSNCMYFFCVFVCFTSFKQSSGRSWYLWSRWPRSCWPWTRTQWNCSKRPTVKLESGQSSAWWLVQNTSFILVDF